jgi:hypothetical protein
MTDSTRLEKSTDLDLRPTYESKQIPKITGLTCERMHANETKHATVNR